MMATVSRGAAFRAALASWWWLPVCVLWMLGYALGAWWLDRWSLGISPDTYFLWQRAFANAMPGYLALLVLVVLTRRLVVSALLVTALTGLLLLVSAKKMALLGTQLIYQDIYFIRGMDASTLDLLSRYLEKPWLVVGGAVGALLVMSLLAWLERPCLPRRGKVRLFAGVTAGLLTVCLVMAVFPWRGGWYADAWIRPSPLDQVKGALHGGTIANVLYMYGLQRHQRFVPDLAALERARQQLASIPAAHQARLEQGAPDVVVVLSESFMDPKRLRGMSDLPDLTPGVRAALASGKGGALRVPTFGGGTVRSEFEVLTGMPVQAFPMAHYPYVDINRARLPGLASTLRRDGYRTVAVHGNSGAFWNRTMTYRAMGIERFVTRRDIPRQQMRLDGGWLSDHSMTDIVLQELDGNVGPQFVLAISIENHGPYTGATKVAHPEALNSIALPQQLTQEAAAELRTYLYHLRNADAEFMRLHQALLARGRPFVLLFFGDHLPALAMGGYAQLGFQDGGHPETQPVPWVLVTGNGVVFPRAPTERALHAWELPSLVLRAAGSPGDPYQAFIGRLSTWLDASGQSTLSPDLQAGLVAAARARLEGTLREKDLR